jgi:hypothetical protein
MDMEKRAADDTFRTGPAAASRSLEKRAGLIRGLLWPIAFYRFAR